MGKNTIFPLILYSLICIVASLDISNDESALLAFKSQISVDPNKILTNNWTLGNSFCNWFGVSCGRRHQRVTGINLANMGLGGTIAVEIGKLSFLRSLVIANNNFHGIIPDTMGNLSRIQVIEMQNNELNSPIPSSFRFLKNLRKLNLYDNSLVGSIPSTIFNISSLIEIDLKNNSLSGSLPMDIFNNLPNLEGLRISENRIGGTIPPSLGTCTKLRRLSILQNNFVGSIPMEMMNLSNLQILYLGLNDLTEYGSTGLISTMADVYSYGIVLMEIFIKKKPTDDIFVGELTMKKYVLELLPDSIMQIVDADLVNGIQENIPAKDSCFRSIMELALQCTTDLPEDRLNMKDVHTRIKKIKLKLLSNTT